MLKTTEVKVRWNPASRKHYESLGYLYTGHGESFIVPVKHLTISSNEYVDVLCDYCEEEITSKTYNSYNKRKKKTYNQKDACKNCSPKFLEEERNYKQKLGLLTRKDNGFWTYKENRIREFNNYIAKHKHINNMSKRDERLYGAIKAYDTNMRHFVEECGYNWEDVSMISSRNFYKDFDNLRKEIEKWVNLNKRFPTQREVIKQIGINQRSIDCFGGIDKIKMRMNYNDKNDLVDSNGFLNKSWLEFLVAEFLIKNNIQYLRERRPFPKKEGQHRSDFQITTEDNDIIHVEVWGYSTKRKRLTPREERYNEKRRYKKSLYEKYNILLIEIEYDCIENKSLNDIQNYLLQKFSEVLCKDFKRIESKYLISPSQMDDEDILDILMEYSDDKVYLPFQSKVIEDGLSGLLTQIRFRHGSYLNFANKYSKKLKTVRYKWDDEIVYTTFQKLNEKGLGLTTKIFAKEKLSGLTTYINNGDLHLVNYKLNFYECYLDNIAGISDDGLSFVKQISKGKVSGRHVVTKKEIEQAKRILSKFYSFKSNNAN